MSRPTGIPLVSIVVIGKNEAAHLDRALASAIVALHSFGKEGEILYVDSASTDESLSIAKAFPQVRVIEWPSGRPSAARARNLGWREARAEFVQFLDGDMELDRHWIAQAMSEIQSKQAAGVGGMLRERHLEGSFGNTGFGLDWNGPSGLVERLGGGALWRRDVLVELDGFRETLPVGEDPDLSLRARAQGHVLWRLRAPMATHDLGIRSFREYFRRGLSVGRSYALVLAQHPTDAKSRGARRRAILTVTMLGLALLGLVGRPEVSLAILGWFVIGFARQFVRNRRAEHSVRLSARHAAHSLFVRLPIAIGYWRARSEARQSAAGADKIGILAAELPAVSETFVYREASALESMGVGVQRFSLRPPRIGEAATHSHDLSLAKALRGLQVVYTKSLLLDFAKSLVSRPGPALGALKWGVRDLFRGQFSRSGQRWRLIPQVIAGLSLAEKLHRHRIRHLHVHFAHAPATVGMYAAKAAGIQFSVTGHANDLFVHGALLREKVQRAAPFFTISEANRAWIAEKTGISPDLILVQRCGADLRAFHGLVPMVGGPKTLLSVARLVPKKGLDLLLRAAATLVSEVPDLRVHLVGEGPEQAALEALTRELGLRDRVRFEGAGSRATVIRRLREASGFVLPCRRDAAGDMDGIPVALMEAMAAGVPVVTTAISGIPELVHHGVSGWVVPPDDVPGLAKAILECLRDSSRSAELAEAGRRFVLEHYDLDRQAQRLAERLGLTQKERERESVEMKP